MYKNEMVLNLWKALGANVIHLAYSEVYQGLKTGLIEAGTNNLASVEPLRWTEVAKYILRTNEFPQSVAFFVNNKAYTGLSDKARNALNGAYKAACQFSEETIPAEGEASIGRMVANDKVTFIRAPMDEFRDRVRPLYQNWEKEGKFGLFKGIIDYINKL